jgi:RHS repeat-associated protein
MTLSRKIINRLSQLIWIFSLFWGLLFFNVSTHAQIIIYFHNDAAGTAQLATDAGGNVVWKENHRPFGERLNNTATVQTGGSLGFTGQPFDISTGLNYMGARYYDPLLGRFLAVDPVNVRPDDIHSFNRYAYGNNNPYKFVDRDGRFSTLAALSGGLLVAGSVTYALQTPEKQREMVLFLQRVFDSVSRADAAPQEGGAKGSAPSLPDVLVGDQSDPRAGPNRSGRKHTSGRLTPTNGGTGDFQNDLDKLTGGVRPWQEGDKAEPGSLVGPNGIFGRPKNSSGGQSIDIPANGNKPHEILHYP